MRHDFGLSAHHRLMAGAAAIVIMAAASPSLAQTRTFDIAAQPAARGIPAFAKQAGVQILASGNVVGGKRTNAVRGSHSVPGGLRLLLQGTGLAASAPDASGIITVRAIGAEADRPQAAAAADDAEASTVSEVMVTGSRLPGGKSDQNPVNTYTADTIARSGQTTLTAFFNSLPEVSVGSSPSVISVFGGQTTVRLRGLPVGTTLVLLDGRRLSSSGAGGATARVDLNAFATDLLERVDIVPTGSSAVYGSDAIGGVVNLVTRKRFSGVGGSISRSFADDYEETRAAVGIGKTFSRGSISLIASYRDQDGLQLTDRELTANTDFRRFAALGGADWRQQTCDPGTVFAGSGNLNGLGLPTAAIPGGAQSALAVSDFAATAGQINVCDYFASRNIIPHIEGVSGILSAEFEATDNITLYADIFYSSYHTDSRWRGLAGSRLSTPATNAFNPFGQTVQVSTVFPVLEGTDGESEMLRPLVGARGGFGENWSWDVAAWRNTTRDDISQVVRNNTALNAALASSNPAAALNVFRPGANSAALLDSIFTRPTNSYRAQQTGADAVLRGRALDLPAGPLAVALGWEGGREKIDRVLFGSGVAATTAGRRETYSVFAEARVPLLAGAVEGEPILQANLAARYDHYSDFGGTTTPQAALEFRPLSRLSFRGAYSEAFKAPTLIQLFAGRTAATNILFDPKLSVSTSIPVVLGGNPDLQPETGSASTFTATWRDPDWNNLRISATYFTIQQQSRIVSVTSLTVLNNEDIFPGRVTRGAPAPGAAVGPVTAIDATNVNFGGLKLSGLDVSASLDLPVGQGVLTPRVALTRMFKYTSQIVPGTPYVDRLARATDSDVWAPRYKATVGLTWAQASFVATAQARYVGRYLDYQVPANTNQGGGYWTVDGSAEVSFADIPVLGSVAPNGLFLRAAVSNLLDRGPKFSNFGSGLVGADLSIDDILGRTVTVTLGKRF